MNSGATGPTMYPQQPYFEEPNPPYGPLQRRLLGIAGALAVLMIGLIVFHALHTGSTGLNAVAEAAERTAQQPGAKLAMEVTYTVEGLPDGATKTIVANGNGSYNARTSRSQATLTVPVPGKSPVTIESVGDDRQVFMHSTMFAGELPGGKEWIGMEPLMGASSESALGSSGGAKSQLDMMRAVEDNVEKLDQQTVRGHLTTRYKGDVSLSREAQILGENGQPEAAQALEAAAEKLDGPVEVEAWIDERGLTRQVRVVEKLGVDGGPTVTVDARMQLFAFGSHPKIEFPPQSQVYDYTPKLRAELGLTGSSSSTPE
jgi:hypothetical protein